MLWFRQLFEKESSSYTYLLADSESLESIIIDPVVTTLDRDLLLLEELGLKLLYSLETHIHADHITSSGMLRKKLGCQIVLGKATGVAGADVYVEDGDRLSFGRFSLEALATPGHTLGCTSFYGEGRIFTGDTLLIRGCGRTDFQEGSSESLYHSVREKLFRLPEDTLVYPAHDYQGRTCSSLKEEKQFNIRLRDGISQEKFSRIMGNLNLAPPQHLKVAVPANQKLGLN